MTAVLVVPATVVLAQASTAQPQDPPADTKAANVWLTNGRFTPGTTKPSTLESWLSGVDMKCFGCRGFDAGGVRPEATNPNSPWLLEGKWRRQTAFGTVRAGFTGVRNYAKPLSTIAPIGGDVDPSVFGMSSLNYAGPTSTWSLTAAFEKTLITFGDSATIGIAGDVSVPISSVSAAEGDLRTRAAASRTIRAGIVFRW